LSKEVARCGQPWSSMSLTDPPSQGTIEVSLFGPGIGEACLIHAGAGDWLVIDSCSDGFSGVNAVLSYFERIGVDPSKTIRVIVATHAHDDHISGISDLVEICPDADFVAPAALNTDQFFSLLAADSEASLLNLSVYSEFRRINALFSPRRGDGRYRFALEGRVIWRRLARDTWPSAELRALSPSDLAFRLAVERLGLMLTPEAASRNRIRGDPNELTVALWVTCGEQALLLGGDLLRGPGADCGWNGVLSSSTLPDERAGVYKVPHHGAPNADHEDVWRLMLSDDVIAILAPYHRGARPRPDEEDRQRIANRASGSYITAPPKDFIPNRLRASTAELSEMGKRASVEAGEPGQIRLRRQIDAGEGWNVELDPPAQELVQQEARPRKRGRR